MLYSVLLLSRLRDGAADAGSGGFTDLLPQESIFG